MTWPLAFSTLGCSGLPLTDVAELARTSGWTGLEIRAGEDEPVHVGLAAAERSAARDALVDGGAKILAIASYVKVASGDVDDACCVADALRHAGLAADLGAPFVRVFPGASGSGAEADDRAVRRLTVIAEQLPAGVAVLLETHDSHPRGADIARVLARVGAPTSKVAAIWDVMHPWRFDEPVHVTAEAIAPYLAHVQVKDVASPTERTPLPLGAGAVPLDAVFDELRALRYEGYLSLEWESKWHPGALPLRDALRESSVFLAGRLS